MWRYLLVGAGGSLGAIARFVVARWADTVVAGRFPLGTFVVNMAGTFLLGLLGGTLAGRLVPHGDDLRLALGVGFLGAFTTFSTFEMETNALLDDGVWTMAVVNVCASLLVGLLALRAGLSLAKVWFTG
jgi:fluoride exporter